MTEDTGRARPRVVIIGGGFGGLTAARTLRNAPVEVTLLDRTNHHVFQPLLYQVATAQLAPSDITAPIRFLMRGQKNATVLLAEATQIEPERRVVCVDGEPGEVPYDFLIVATGARHSYFGHDDWEPLAPGLKSIGDAVEVRRRFLLAFEEAEKTDDPVERQAYQTFVIVGGGATGMELAGVMPEIAKNALRADFRRIDTRNTRVILLEGGPRLIPTFPQSLADRAKRDLEKLGVEVRLNCLVTRIEPDAVYAGDERIPTRTVFWAAGNAASPLARSLGVPLDRVGRVPVEKDLSVPGRPEVFVVGDLATLTQENGKPVPWVAQGAIQGGRRAAQNIECDLRGRPRRPFRYWDKGNMAVLGRARALAEIGRFRFTGFVAWLMWLGLHIVYLVGFRNRLSVLLQWAYAYFTYQRGVRLISDPVPRMPDETAVPGPPSVKTGP